jgi:hypothetical protein
MLQASLVALTPRFVESAAIPYELLVMTVIIDIADEL